MSCSEELSELRGGVSVSECVTAHLKLKFPNLQVFPDWDLAVLGWSLRKVGFEERFQWGTMP